MFNLLSDNLRTSYVIKLAGNHFHVPNARSLFSSGFLPRYTSNLPSDFLSYIQLIKSNELRGKLLSLLSQYDQAEQALQLISVEPFSPYFLAFVFAAQGQEQLALDTFLSVPDISFLLMRLGTDEHENQHYATAITFFESALRADKEVQLNRALLYETLSKDYYQLENFSTALSWAKKWVEADLLNLNATSWLATLYLWQGQPEAAYQAWQRVEEIGASNHHYYAGHMGRIMQARGNWDQALEYYRQNWEINQNNPYAAADSAWYLGNALFHQGFIDEARPYLEFVVLNGGPILHESARDKLHQIDQDSQP